MNGYAQSKHHFSTCLLFGLLFALTILLCVLPAIDAKAAEIVASGTCGADGDNLTWTLDDDGLLTISGEGEMDNFLTVDAPWYSIGNIKSVVIEDGITFISYNAFRNCYNLTSVTIPGSVTRIGVQAFGGCRSLTSVTIPDSVTSIEKEAFLGCSSLTSVTIPNSVTNIGSSVFENCYKLISAGPIGSGCSIEFGWKYTIPAYAFYFCAGLTSITIPNSVTSIGVASFWNCTSLTNVTIPDSVTNIGSSAFQYCTGLASVSMGNSINSIGGHAFSSCSSLNDVFFNGTENQWNTISIGTSNDPLTKATRHYALVASGTCGDDLTWTLDSNGVLTISGTGDMDDYSSQAGVPWYSYRSSITSVVIEDGVTSIGDHAFYNCRSLTSVTIPGSVTSIGDYAFLSCSKLTSVTIPEDVTNIGNEAFAGCSSLTNVTIPESVTSIGDWTFSDCSSLTSIVINSRGTSFGWAVFSGCNSLTSVTFPDWLFYSNNSASSVFSNCPNLTIYGYSGTWLEGWVEDSGISFSPLGAAPNWIDGEYDMPAIANRVIHITNAEDLAWLAQYVNAGHPLTSYKVVLEADIDLSGKLWTPIGTEDTRFSGSFDGQGHTISGLTISIWPDDTHNYGGCLFGYTSDADIRNTCLANAALTYGREGYWVQAVSDGSVTNCGAWGWACRTANVRSDSKLSWSSFDTPGGNCSYVGAWNMDGVDPVTVDYLRSVEFREWINSCPSSGLYDWVADTDSSNNDFPRMATEVSIRTWEDVAEEVTPQSGVYDVYTPQQLGYIGKIVNSGNTLSGKTIRLQADIDLSVLYWIPMSTLNADFDGNGHSITGLRVGNESFPSPTGGLFSRINGKVTNLTLAGDIYSSGYAGMIATSSNTEITDCHASGVVNGAGNVGGIVGDAYGTLSSCSFIGSVIGTDDGWGGSNCGGIVGIMYDYMGDYYSIVDQCSFSGSVSGPIVGGIVGFSRNVSRCSAIGTLTGNTAGGICGIGGSSCSIDNCYSICEIKGINAAGGILGQSNYNIISNCYAGGSVDGVANVGALFGDLNGSYNNTFENCYWNQDAEYTLDGLPDIPRACGNGEDLDGVTALTAAQMRQQSSFVGFDFDTVWAIDASTNDGMPYLRQQETSGYLVTINNLTNNKAEIGEIEDGGSYSGETTFTVSCDKACAVLCTTDGGQTYTRLKGTKTVENKYSFTIYVTQPMTIVVAMKGDVNMDGRINALDVAMTKAGQLNKITLTPLQRQIVDVNADNRLNALDVAMTKAGQLNKITLGWDI